MYLMYVDESGDSGLINSPTRYFALTGLVVHELRWKVYLDQIIDFRRQLKSKFGLKLREEIHASAMINHPGELVRIKRNDRLTIIRKYAEIMATMTDISLINILVDKQDKESSFGVFESAWRALIQRFENTISNRNFPGPANPDDKGMIFSDNSDNKKITTLLRKMRYYNPIPHMQSLRIPGYRNITVTRLIEDPNFRDSGYSYFIQTVDMAAFLLYQYFDPSGYIRKKGARQYFERLDPILCKVASAEDLRGIVHL